MGVGNHFILGLIYTRHIMILSQLLCRACITSPSRSADNSDKNFISHSWRKLNSLSNNFNLIQATILLVLFCFVLLCLLAQALRHIMAWLFMTGLLIMTKTDSSRT